MSKFHTLKIASVRNETPDSISIGFEIPAELKAEFQYKHGQYLTLRAEVQGEDIRRAYSLCSSPQADTLPEVTVKRVTDGKMSNYLNDWAQVGNTLEVMPPQGRFFAELEPGAQRHYFLLGGGSGITPLFSILKSVLLREPRSKITLIYGNRNPQSIIFRNALQEWQGRYPERLQIDWWVDETDAGFTGNVGVLNAETVAQRVKHYQTDIARREYFLCGPGGFMEGAKSGLELLGVKEGEYHIEYFSSATPQKEEEAEVTGADEVSGTAGVTVILEGKSYDLQISDNTTILQAAIKAGIDPPFSCEAGVCSTCLAKVHEGKVRMDENNILTQSEVDKGYVLTCQAHPTTSYVKLEFFE